MRHALAPGTGDPASFTIGDCSTQRNLSDKGRTQSRAIGESFRKNGLHKAEVYSSQWCRCLETAELLALGPVQELKILNSFFARYERRDEQTAGLRNWLGEKEIRTPLILVTHQVNITAFTDVFPSSGEMVVVRKDEGNRFTVLGTIGFE
jgi:phosphohistidine phosphatase SixA